MADANEKSEARKSNSSPEKDAAPPAVPPSSILSDMEDGEDEEEYDEEEEEEEEYEEEDDESEQEEEEEEEEEEEKVNNEIKTDEDKNKGKTIEKKETKNEKAVKEDEKKKEPENGKEISEISNGKGKRLRPKDKDKDKDKRNGNNPESSTKKKASKRVESMGMVFMCTSKTKTDCFHYKVLGLPANKQDQVAKIYKGMRLFLFDVDLRLMYGIFKAAGPGGYNLEPKAFNADFPSQVRFTVLEDCLPVAEEKFKDVLKENYYTRNKFEGLLKADQVKKLCKIFAVTSKQGLRSNKRKSRPLENNRIRPRISSRPDESRDRKKRRLRPREDDRRARSRDRSRDRDRGRDRERERDRRPRSPPPPRREKRRHEYERSPVLYERAPVVRYLPPPLSPPRSYAYERPPFDMHPYVHDRVPEPHRVYHDEVRERERDPYYVYNNREAAPVYRDGVYALPPPEYHIVSREYNPPPVMEPPEYRVRVPGYRDVGPPSEYRSSSGMLPEYRSSTHRTHYRY